MNIHDLTTELQSFMIIEQSLINKALKSKINQKNNFEFNKLVEDWMNGVYDNDPEVLLNEIEHLLEE